MKKKIAILLSLVLIIGVFYGYTLYTRIYSTNVTENTAIFIPTKANFDQVIEIVKPHIKDVNGFIWVAKKKKYHQSVKSGKFDIKQGMNNNSLVNLLRSGKQSTVNLTFNNQDSLEKLSGRLAEQLEIDSLTILTALTDRTFLAENNLAPQDVLGIFIPNSYQVYWNTSAEKLRDRMLREYKKFWNEERMAKAKALNMTPHEVSTLASIVQKETSKVSERPIVAGLYLNRLRDGWALQADPTIIFALKQKNGQDFNVKRVLTADLTIDSPYNTYKNTGLPPSLISMPDISSIDAVLNPKKHDYYYMCASVTNIGAHEFARTLAQHNVNAAKYQRWISKQGINR
ncbi:endolytic transglycosylase MltG [Flavobacteriaceae bacterium F08102]|nr:endolytic transglycosylase MltG [Flavobacteriaceae bacterium F08102]